MLPSETFCAKDIYLWSFYSYGILHSKSKSMKQQLQTNAVPFPD